MECGNGTSPETNFDFQNFSHITVAPAVGIILILCFLEKRQKTGHCDGRPAMVIALNLLDGFENRMSYATAFGTVVVEIMNLFLQSSSSYLFAYPLWTVGLFLQLQALEIAVISFPLFACFTSRHKLVGGLLGFLYTAVLFGGSIARTISEYCWYEDVTQILQNIPILFCHAFLLVKYAWVFIRALKSKIFVVQACTDIVRPHQSQHVRLLLKGYYDAISLKDKKFCDKLWYAPIRGFKYPVKIICAIFIIVVILFQSVVGFLISGIEITSAFEFLENDTLKVHFQNRTIVLFSPGLVKGIIATYNTSLAIAFVTALFQIYFFLKTYRKHVLRMYRGDRSFLGDVHEESEYTIAYNLRFSGYHISYFLWGTAIHLLSLLFWGCVICYAFFLMGANNYLTKFLISVAQSLSFPATTILIFYLQVLLSRRVFLQNKIHPSDEHPPLNVDNRKFYENFNFFSLFGSLTIGIFTCFFRIIIGEAQSILMVGRLDQSIFMKHTEDWDKGYVAYVCMLNVDNTHNHPVLRTFCGLLWDWVLERRELGDVGGHLHVLPKRKYRTFPSVEEANEAERLGYDVFIKFENPKILKRNTQALRRWKVAYTLIRNPELQKLRRGSRTEFDSSNGFSRSCGGPYKELTNFSSQA